jgi:hypothetical protein
MNYSRYKEYEVFIRLRATELTRLDAACCFTSHNLGLTVGVGSPTVTLRYAKPYRPLSLPTVASTPHCDP